MNQKRGFVTVATGKYYCWLAQNLAMSYRLYSKTEYPLYAITDQQGEKLLKKYFDGVIVLEKPSYTFMDKIAVYENSPFDETVFIDADMNVTRDFGFLFDLFEKNSSSVSCLGSMRAITEDDRPNHFGSAAIERFHLTQYVAFNGGVYYYKKSREADEFIRLIYDELAQDYQKNEMKVFRTGQMADEPLVGLAMLLKGMEPLNSDINIMSLVLEMDSLKWVMKNRRCTFIRYGETVSPILLHYGTHNTRHKKYVYYNSIVRCRYFKIPFLTPFYLVYREIRLLFIHIKRPQDRKAFRQWFFSHFTMEHIRYRKSQIKSLFNRS